MDPLTKSIDLLVPVRLLELVLAVISFRVVALFTHRLRVQKSRPKTHFVCLVSLIVTCAPCPDHFSSSNSTQIRCNTIYAYSQHVNKQFCIPEKGWICRADPQDHYWHQCSTGHDFGQVFEEWHYEWNNPQDDTTSLCREAPNQHHRLQRCGRIFIDRYRHFGRDEDTDTKLRWDMYVPWWWW